MKKLIKYIVLVLVTLFTFSCKKEETHKVKFELEFFETPSTGSSNFLEVTCKVGVPPLSSINFEDEEKVPRFDIEPGYVWSYEHNVNDGDLVSFSVYSQLSYMFVMKIYVDNELISSRTVKTSDNSYSGGVEVVDQYGLNNKEESNYPIIEFYYYE